MYLIKRNNGIFYVEFKDKSRKKKRLSTGCKDKYEAKTFLINFQKGLQKKSSDDFQKKESIVVVPKTLTSQPTSIKVKDFFIEYKSFIDSFKSKKYARLVRNTIEFFNENFSETELKELSNREIEMLLIKKYNLSKYSAMAHFRNLRAAFNKAMEWEYISKNPISKIKLPKIPKTIPKFITEDDLLKIMNEARSNAYSNIFLTAYFTGMRRSEILSLTWSNVDLKSRTIHLANNDNFNTKNKKDRIIPMHPKVISLIEELEVKKRSDLIFTKLNGFPFSKDVITAHFRHCVLKAKLDDRIHFHSLRHSFASNLVRKGVPIIVVKELLGHEDISTTMIYSHVRRNDLVEAVMML